MCDISFDISIVGIHLCVSYFGWYIYHCSGDNCGSESSKKQKARYCKKIVFML